MEHRVVYAPMPSTQRERMMSPYTQKKKRKAKAMSTPTGSCHECMQLKCPSASVVYEPGCCPTFRPRIKPAPTEYLEGDAYPYARGCETAVFYYTEMDIERGLLTGYVDASGHLAVSTCVPIRLTMQEAEQHLGGSYGEAEPPIHLLPKSTEMVIACQVQTDLSE